MYTILKQNFYKRAHLLFAIRDTKGPLCHWPSRNCSMLRRREVADFPALWFPRDSPSLKVN